MEEEQFILRLPPQLVDRMRTALASKNQRKDAPTPTPDPIDNNDEDAAAPTNKDSAKSAKNKGDKGESDKKSTFKIDFIDKRNATMTLDGTVYPATLVDLPAIVESHKTADKRAFYKSGDIHQMLIVRMPDEPNPFEKPSSGPPPSETAPPASVPSPVPVSSTQAEGQSNAASEKLPTNNQKQFQLKGGLTPAAKDARRRLAEPPRTYPPVMVTRTEMLVKNVIEHKIKFRDKSATVPPTAANASTNPASKPASTQDVSTDKDKALPDNRSKNKDGKDKDKDKDKDKEDTQGRDDKDIADTASDIGPAVGTPSDVALLAPVAPSPMPDAPTPTPGTPSLMDGAGTPAMIGDGDGDSDDDNNNRAASDDDDINDEDDEDMQELLEMADEAADEAAEDSRDEEEEARKVIERRNLDLQIRAERSRLATLRNQEKAASHPLMLRRFGDKAKQVEQEIEELEKKLAAIQ